ncbi:MAG: hypothetical protein QM681_15265 [Novosphingobium sp.]
MPTSSAPFFFASSPITSEAARRIPGHLRLTTGRSIFQHTRCAFYDVVNALKNGDVIVAFQASSPKTSKPAHVAGFFRPSAVAPWTRREVIVTTTMILGLFFIVLVSQAFVS